MFNPFFDFRVQNYYLFIKCIIATFGHAYHIPLLLLTLYYMRTFALTNQRHAPATLTFIICSCAPVHSEKEKELQT